MSSIFDIELLYQSRKIKIGCLAITESNKNPLSFEYDSSWLKNGYALGADLPLTFGVHRVIPLRIPGRAGLLSRASSFGFLCDASPGAWVPTLLERAEFFGLKANGLPAKSNSANKLLFSVGHPGDAFSAYSCKDSTFAIRKKSTSSTENRSLSKIVRLMEAYPGNLRRFTEEDIALLVNNTTDIGGASIKALVTLTRDGKTTDWVVRCKRPEDPCATPLWTAVTASLARSAGIRVPDFSYELCARFGAFLEKRFDRTEGGEPLMALSAATLCARPSPYKALTAPIPSWLDVADIINREGSAPAEDLRELFLRLVFATFVSLPGLTLERIWFVRQGGGWRLAPMSAPCAMPPLSGSRQLAIPLSGNDAASSIEKLEEASRYFGVPRQEVRLITLEVAKAVHAWREKAMSAGADLSEIASMQAAFLS